VLVNRITSIKTTVTKLVTSHKIHSCEISLVRVKPLLSNGCGRGEIGKHKGLKIGKHPSRVTVPPSNLLINNNNLLDLISDVSVTRMRGVVTW
jgi:hypothetical protein